MWKLIWGMWFAICLFPSLSVYSRIISLSFGRDHLALLSVDGWIVATQKSPFIGQSESGTGICLNLKFDSEAKSSILFSRVQLDFSFSASSPYLVAKLPFWSGVKMFVHLKSLGFRICLLPDLWVRLLSPSMIAVAQFAVNWADFR